MRQEQDAIPERQPERLRWPLCYAAEGWSVTVDRHPDGGLFALLEGPSPAGLMLEEGLLPLHRRRWTRLPLTAMPAELTLCPVDGGAHTLTRR
ncbi:MAG: hypothetical protein H6739_13640 [Alphaproteobacteria bacterium]|nr:hypothetical protein [Alphaproteobacteria bacterium]